MGGQLQRAVSIPIEIISLDHLLKKRKHMANNPSPKGVNIKRRRQKTNKIIRTMRNKQRNTKNNRNNKYKSRKRLKYSSTNLERRQIMKFRYKS
jgi:hypothetical protein